jgi:hypothetical protein
MVLVNSQSRSRFLAVDDYGTGGIWFVVVAANEDEIRKALPTVRVFAPGMRPDWMTAEDLRQIEVSRTFDIDDLPSSDWMSRLREGRP